MPFYLLYDMSKCTQVEFCPIVTWATSRPEVYEKSIGRKSDLVWFAYRVELGLEARLGTCAEVLEMEQQELLKDAFTNYECTIEDKGTL